MTNDPSLSRRVSRLENDTESLYELVTEVRSAQDAHSRRFDRIETSLGEVTATLGDHANRFDRIASTLGEVTATLGDHANRFDRIDRTLNEVVRRLPEPS